MGINGSRTMAWLAALALLLLLAAPLVLASCGGSSAASGGSGSLIGAWMPAKGSLTFRANSGGGSGYTWSPHAMPAGGIVVVEKDGAFQVTLVSADGKRFAAGEAVPQGDLLRVRILPTTYGDSTQFFLSSHGKDSAQLIAAPRGSPAPQDWSIDLVPGTFPAMGQ